MNLSQPTNAETAAAGHITALSPYLMTPCINQAPQRAQAPHQLPPFLGKPLATIAVLGVGVRGDGSGLKPVQDALALPAAMKGQLGRSSRAFRKLSCACFSRPGPSRPHSRPLAATMQDQYTSNYTCRRTDSKHARHTRVNAATQADAIQTKRRPVFMLQHRQAHSNREAG
jgi:hypothetical protein